MVKIKLLSKKFHYLFQLLLRDIYRRNFFSKRFFLDTCFTIISRSVVLSIFVTSFADVHRSWVITAFLKIMQNLQANPGAGVCF